MNGYDDLCDLDLAGVKWEITDTPAAATNANDAAPRPPQAAINAGGATNPVPPRAPMGMDVAVSMAARPTDAAALGRMVVEFNHPLRAGGAAPVAGHIAPTRGGLLIITDMPGAEDEATGHILSGAAGELMDKMLGAIGLSRESVSIVPLLNWRTPGGRAPSRLELDLARPFVERAIELLGPRVILTLGTLAAAEIANATLPKAHGSVITRPEGGVIVPIFHPNYLLLKPTAKRDAWTALQQVQNLLKNQ